MRNIHLILAAALLANTAWAEPAASADASRGIFPGASAEADSSLVLTGDQVLRMPGTSKTRASLPEGTRVKLSTTVKVRAQGKTYQVELWEGTRPEASEDGGFGEEVAVLAVFPEGAKAPTDVAEVKTDKETYLSEKAIPLGSDDAFELSNDHLNAGNDNNDVSLFHLRNGRLRRIAEVWTSSAMDMDCAKSFADSLRWRIEAKTSGLPDVVAEVETVHAPTDFQQDCGRKRPKEWRSRTRTTYHWDAAKDRYVAAAGTDKRR